jgi:hypothetical protein
MNLKIEPSSRIFGSSCHIAPNKEISNRFNVAYGML